MKRKLLKGWRAEEKSMKADGDDEIENMKRNVERNDNERQSVKKVNNINVMT